MTTVAVFLTIGGKVLFGFCGILLVMSTGSHTKLKQWIRRTAFPSQHTGAAISCASHSKSLPPLHTTKSLICTFLLVALLPQ